MPKPRAVELKVNFTLLVRTDSLDQLISLNDETVMKVIEVAGCPVRATCAWDSVFTSERNVQHIRFVVAAVIALTTVHAPAIASGGERQRGFTDRCALTIVAV